jgi:hypothetical protein
VLLEDTPFFTAFELPTLAVLAALDGVAHGGHFGGFFFSLYLLDKEEKNSSGARKVRKKIADSRERRWWLCRGFSRNGGKTFHPGEKNSRKWVD